MVESRDCSWTLQLDLNSIFKTFNNIQNDGTAAVRASQFIPSCKLSLLSPTAITCSIPRHGSNHSNSDGHICGTSSNCSWSIYDIFSGHCLLAFITSQTYTHWHSRYKYCMLYIATFSHRILRCWVCYVWFTAPYNQQSFSRMTKSPLLNFKLIGS